MDRRFFAWFLLFTSVFFLWSSSRDRARLQKERDQQAALVQEKEDALEAEKLKATAAEKLAASDVPLPPAIPEQFFTLGSMDANDKRPLMITLSNRGASVDRVELMARQADGSFQYRALEARYGYPGYLALGEVRGGLVIQNVPVGSPADIADSDDPTKPGGIEVGDVITRVGGQAVRTLPDYYDAIRKFDAGQAVRFTVVRGVDLQAEPVRNAAVGQDQATTELISQPKPDAIEDKGIATKAADEANATQNEIATAAPASQPAAEITELPTENELSTAAQTNDNDPADSPLKADLPRLQFVIKLIEQPLDIIRNSNHYPAEQVDGNRQRGSLLTTLSFIDGRAISEGKQFIVGLDQLLDRNWEAKAIENGVDFEMPLRAFLLQSGIDADLTMVKSYRLKPYDDQSPLNNYDFELTTTIRNNTDVPHKVAIRQEGLSGLTIEGWWYSVKQATEFMNGAGARDVMVGREGGTHELFTRRTIQNNAVKNKTKPDVAILGPADSDDARSLRYIGVDAQYFSAALLPVSQSVNSLDNLQRAGAMAIANVDGASGIKPNKDIAMNVGFYVETEPREITKDAAYEEQFKIFVGPKDPPLLAAYGMRDVVYYGWSIFAFVAKPLSAVLHFFYSMVRNYGIAIMMLTVLVRSCMFPLSWRAAVMGQRMQEMAPEVKKINELYKDDMQKRGVETQKLYKKYKLNPMASCLPMFIQLPIFIGLYRTVSTDVSLRQKPLIPSWDWCANLAGPDQFTLFPSWMPEMLIGKGTGYFGPYFNLLPIVTCALFIIQQKVLMPKATDDQTRMTQRIMMFMTIFMAVLFFKVPAGLCIYFITSSCWSLVERTLVKKYMPAAKPVVDGDGGLALIGGGKSPGAMTPAPYKPAPIKPKGKPAKPPEKLSEIFPWLQKQLKRNPPSAVRSGTAPGSSNTNSVTAATATANRNKVAKRRRKKS